jgi:hypothetical protein
VGLLSALSLEKIGLEALRLPASKRLGRSGMMVLPSLGSVASMHSLHIWQVAVTLPATSAGSSTTE